MTRIGNRWEQLRKQNAKALIPFIMAGDPDIPKSIEVVLALAEAGSDVIELGVPFSEPIADGPVVQRAGERALQKGAYLPAILDMVREIRRRSEVPLAALQLSQSGFAVRSGTLRLRRRGSRG